MQITSGSLTGKFGTRAQYWGERMLDEGFVHILSSTTLIDQPRPRAESTASDTNLLTCASLSDLARSRIAPTIALNSSLRLPEPARDDADISWTT